MKRLRDYFLSSYDDASYVVREKAYAYLWVSIVFIFLVAAVIVFNMIQAFRENLPLNGINSLLIVATLLALLLLRRGLYSLSTTILIIALTFLWTGGLYLKMEGFLLTGVNSYLYFMFGLMVIVSLFGTPRMFGMVTILLTGVNTGIIIIAAKKAATPVFKNILNQSVNIYICIGVIFTFSWLISRITSHALEKTEEELAEKKELNESLERKVEERTRDIEAAMEEVSVMNDNLVQVNRDLESAHKIMTTDMRMAVNVQQSFLPRRAPSVIEWDIAFTFRPMAGISGDFYDFYTENGELIGLSLFDVSGHGIASGLVTMIAKSIVFRNFISGRDRDLGHVMNDINAQLVQELGDVDNYLTGILIRIRDGRLEYVNAAHPDIFIRRGDSGDIISPVGRDNVKRGPILAVGAIRMDYPVSILEMNPGDSLVLFSDCLYESSNKSEEQYGLERVRESVASIPDGSGAGEQLDILINDLTRFTGTQPLKDDLTVIIIQKR